MIELGSYMTRGALVSKTNTKGIRSEHLVFGFGLGLLVIFRLFEDAIHMSKIYNARAIERREDGQFPHLDCLQ